MASNLILKTGGVIAGDPGIIYFLIILLVTSLQSMKEKECEENNFFLICVLGMFYTNLLQIYIYLHVYILQVSLLQCIIKFYQLSIITTC